LEKIQKTVHNILRAVNLFQTSVNQTGITEVLCYIQLLTLEISARKWLICFILASLEAASVRKEYDDSSAKLSKLQSRISSLSQKLKHDFG